MKDSRYKVIIQFLCATTNTKIVKKGKKLYYFFFHEDFYPIFLQNQSNVVLTKNIIKTQNNLGTFLKKEKSFLEMKRVIVLFRSNNYFSNKRYYFDNLSKQKKKNYFSIYLRKYCFSFTFYP
jgi:tRNA uridine 5-carbamoylmethylation protein Kti12